MPFFHSLLLAFCQYTETTTCSGRLSQVDRQFPVIEESPEPYALPLLIRVELDLATRHFCPVRQPLRF